MSKTGVIVALVVAIVLAGAALFLLRDGRQSAPTGPLLVFDPAKATSVTVAQPGGGSAAIGRDPATGEWDVYVIEADGRQVGRWPAAAAQVRAALRILSTLTPARAADAGVAPEAGARSVVVTVEGGEKQTMTISEKVLAGQVLVQAGPRTGWVGSDVAEMLVKSGPREWRDAAALSGLGPDVSRITLKGQAGTVALARVQGKWGIREPVQEAADQQAIVKLLTALSTLPITDFLDGGVPADTGLDKAMAELIIESDLRDDTGKVTTVRRGLRVGRQGDIAGKTVFAEVSRGADPGRVVKVSAEQLAALTTDPIAYCSKRTLQTPAADVGRIVVAGRSFERGLDGWRERKGAGDALPVTKEDEAGLAALVQALTQQDAEAMSLVDRPEKAPAFATVEIASTGGTPLATVEFYRLAGSGGESLATRVGKVWRGYAPGAAAAWTWLESLAAR